MLMDSAHIQEKEASGLVRDTRSRKMARRAEVALLYTVEQARTSLGRFVPTDYDDWIEPGPGVRCRFRDAGHILGSAIPTTSASAYTCRLVASGRHWPADAPGAGDPADRPADYLCVGRPLRQPRPPLLRRHLRRVALAAAAHARGRWRQRDHPGVRGQAYQEVLFVLADLVRRTHRPTRRRGRLADGPAVTALTVRHTALWDDETRALYAWAEANPGRFRVRFVQDVEKSKALNAVPGGLVVISASGMCDAGRIKHHLRHNLGSRRECAVVIAGFQAAGTPRPPAGRRCTRSPVRRTYPRCVRASIPSALRPRRPARTPRLAARLRRKRHGAPSWRNGEPSRLRRLHRGGRARTGWSRVEAARPGAGRARVSVRASGQEAARAAQALWRDSRPDRADRNACPCTVIRPGVAEVVEDATGSQASG